MGRNRFVSPQVDRLPLSDGDWIDVKHELNAGEQRAVFAGMVKEHRAGEVASIDTKRVGLTKIMAYLLGWSLTDGTGPVKVSESAVNNLQNDSYREIKDAIDTHEARVDQERDERKNGQAGESASSLISPSVAS